MKCLIPSQGFQGASFGMLEYILHHIFPTEPPFHTTRKKKEFVYKILSTSLIRLAFRRYNWSESIPNISLAPSAHAVHVAIHARALSASTPKPRTRQNLLHTSRRIPGSRYFICGSKAAVSLLGSRRFRC